MARINVLCVCLSSTIQRTVTFRTLALTNVNRSEHYRMDASGKAVNAARVLYQLERLDTGTGSALPIDSRDSGVKVVCPLGEENAEEFLRLSSRDGLSVDAIRTPGRTRECWTLLDDTMGSTTELVVGEEAERDTEYPMLEGELLEAVERDMAGCEAVLLAGSRPAMWSCGLVAYIARMAKDAHRLLLADYHGEDLNRTLAVCTPDIIKINKEEFCATFDINPFITDDLLVRAVEEQSKRRECIIIVTQGARSTVAARCGVSYVFPAEQVKAVNTTACGDSFDAGFLYEWLATHDMEASLARGTWCAARNAEREAPGDVMTEYGER